MKSTLVIKNSFSRLQDFPSEVLSDVDEVLTYKNDIEGEKAALFKQMKFWKSKKTSKSPVTARKARQMCGWISKQIKDLEANEYVKWLKGDTFPTGHLNIVKDVLEVIYPDYKIIDHRKVPDRQFDFYLCEDFPKPRYYQEEMHEQGVNTGRGVFESAVGCHAKGTEIIMFDGSLKKVEDIKENDLLMGPDSKPRTVVKLYKGTEPLFRINPIKFGEPFIVNESHILSLERTKKRGEKDYGKKYINRGKVSFKGHNPKTNISLREYINKSQDFKNLWKLYRTPVDFKDKKTSFEIPPYILGLWLGDGSAHEPSLTSMDKEIIDEWLLWGYKEKLHLNIRNKKNSRAKTYCFSSKSIKENKGTTLLRKLNIYNNKHIPFQYLTSSKKDRLELLAGLMDTDGSLGTGFFDFIQKSEILAKQVAFLARSLGFGVNVKLCQKRATNSKSQEKGTYYRLSICGDISLIPCRLPRKQSSERLQKKSVLRSGFSIEALGEGEFFGFQLDSDGLYLLSDFTVTHNSGKSLVLMRLIHNFGVKSLIVVPSKPLMNQLKKGLIKHFGRRNVAVVTSSKLSDSKMRKLKKTPIRLINIQSLASLNKKKAIKEYIEDINAIYIDEIHHAGSKSYTDLLPALEHVYYRFGFTGTFLRNDEKTLDMWGFLSNRLYNYPAWKAIEEGYLTPIEAIIHKVQGSSSKNYQKEYKKNYCGSPVILEKIKEILTDFVKKDEQVLILVNRKDQAGKVIHEFLDDLGFDNTYISGDDDKDTIDEALEAFNKKEIRILIGSTVIGEGIDITSSDHLIMAQGGKSEIAIVQATGRLVRLFEGKLKGILHDFRFVDTKYMEKHLRARKSIYKRVFAAKVIEK